MRRVLLEGFGLVRVREVDEALPVVVRERALSSGRWSGALDRAVAREDALSEEIVRGVVGRKLEVAVYEAVADPLLEELRQVVDESDFDNPLERSPWEQAQPYRVNTAEKAVAADCQLEQLGVFVA